MTYTFVCALSELTSQKPQLFTIDSVKILFVKDLENKIWAFDAICTHADKSLENGNWDPEKGLITCPFHRAVFSIYQGGLAIKSPAVLPLKIYSTEIKIKDSEPIVMIDLDS